jgi:hypothetical protein
MPGQRHTARPRARGSWLPRLAGLGVIVVLAAGGVAAYVAGFHPAASKRPAPLPTRVASTLTVGLVAEALSGGGSAGIDQLLSPQQRPAFSPVGISQQQLPQGQPEWIADVMTDGGYIFIYLPTSQCLASAGPRARPRLSAERCDLSRAQRWRRLGAGVLVDGHDFYQFADMSSGKCITQGSGSAAQSLPAGLTACDPARPASQLLAFWWSAG